MNVSVTRSDEVHEMQQATSEAVIVRARRFSARALRRGGFTILEILIAIVVLVLGISGIIALFPTAIDSGNQTVEDSYAAAITQSVVDAISVGIRESRYGYLDSGSRSWTFFIFDHDGVLDRPPAQADRLEYDDNADALWARDYTVLLPQAKTDPNADYKKEPVFIYPVPLPAGYTNNPANGAEYERSPAALASTGARDNLLEDTDPTKSCWRDATDGSRTPWVPRVYHLGRYRDPGNFGSLPDEKKPTYQSGRPPFGVVRDEFLGDTGAAAASGSASIALDPYPTYSFAFTIQRAKIDSNNDGKITENDDQYSNNLFTVKVMVFRNFDDIAAEELRDPASGRAVPKSNIPIREFVTLISM